MRIKPPSVNDDVANHTRDFTEPPSHLGVLVFFPRELSHESDVVLLEKPLDHGHEGIPVVGQLLIACAAAVGRVGTGVTRITRSSVC